MYKSLNIPVVTGKKNKKTPSQISEDGAVTGKGKQKTELIKKPPKKEYHKKMISLFCR